MARVTSEEAVEKAGNRYDLIIMASARVRELHRGHLPKVSEPGGPVTTALREVEQGHVGREYLKKVPIQKST